MNTNFVTRVLVFLILFLDANSEVYHSYFKTSLSGKEYKDFINRGIFNVCGKETRPCTVEEGRRIDGSCNNIEDPISGMAGLPYGRLLPAKYGINSSLPTASDGSSLPLARRVRTELISDIVEVSTVFNTAGVHFAEFVVFDVTTSNALLNVLINKKECCTPAGEKDPECMPIMIPEDDPYLGGSDIHCVNLMRLQAFQDLECLTNDIQREQINFATPLIDLSPVYGIDDTEAADLRTFTKGMMKMVERKKATFPPNIKHPFCMANRPNETSCYGFGQPIGNFDARLTLLALWFFRLHNFLASKLAEINPCWDDQKLYDVARQINIAIMQNIYMYEWTPKFLGQEMLPDKEIIYNKKDKVNDYNSSIRPHVLVEFVVAMRTLHTMVDGRLASYYPNGQFENAIPFCDQLGRPAFVENNLEGITQGIFWQSITDVVTIEDPNISEKISSQFKTTKDPFTMDVARARDFGLPPYHQYRDYCGLQPASSFDDFLDVMPQQAVEKLKTVYANFQDVELMVALYREKFLENSFAGATLQCIMMKQNQVWRQADRFWFEHEDQKTSFTNEQIEEIKKITFSRVACNVADGIYKIQKYAFLSPGPKNPQVWCSQIPFLDLTKWKENCVKFDCV